jgi:hypothetical protein
VHTERIYHAMQRTVTESHESSALTGVLSKQFGCEMHVCHVDSVEPWYPEDPKLNDGLVAVLTTMAARPPSHLRAGAFVEPLPDGRDVRPVDIPTQPNAVLVLVSDDCSSRMAAATAREMATNGMRTRPAAPGSPGAHWSHASTRAAAGSAAT